MLLLPLLLRGRRGAAVPGVPRGSGRGASAPARRGGGYRGDASRAAQPGSAGPAGARRPARRHRASARPPPDSITHTRRRHLPTPARGVAPSDLAAGGGRVPRRAPRSWHGEPGPGPPRPAPPRPPPLRGAGCRGVCVMGLFEVACCSTRRLQKGALSLYVKKRNKSQRAFRPKYETFIFSNSISHSVSIS